MKKTYELEVNFYTENVLSSNVIADAEELSAWFSNADLNSSYLKVNFIDRENNNIDLTNYNIYVNWLLPNHEKRLQELGIEKEDNYYAAIKVPSEAINNKRGKLYFNFTLENMDTKETLNSPSFVITLVSSLSNSKVIDDKLITTVKNAQLLNGKSEEELAEKIAGKVGDIKIEGLATETFVEEKIEEVKDEINETVDEKINDIDLTPYVRSEDLSQVAKSGDYVDLINVPKTVVENNEVNINEMDSGVFTLLNCTVKFNNKNIETDINTTLFTYNTNNIISFIIFNKDNIIYNINDVIKTISLSNLAYRNDFNEYAKVKDVDNAIQENVDDIKEYINDKNEELHTTIDKENVVFRDTIYNTITQTFAKVPDTYLTNYATKDYVMDYVANAVKDIKAGLSKEDIEKIISEKIADVDVDLSNYYTKQEVDNLIPDTDNFYTKQEIDNKGYLTMEEGDKRYMSANYNIDNKKPAYGEYKTILKGDFFKEYYILTDFWNTQVTSNHDTRRIIRYVQRIPNTDYFFAYIDNNGSGIEKGFSIFNFLNKKVLNEVSYTTFTQLGLVFPDNSTNFRIYMHSNKPVISFTYMQADKTIKHAFLHINMEDYTVNVVEDVTLIDSSYNFESFIDANINKDFTRLVVCVYKYATDNNNIVFCKIEETDDNQLNITDKINCNNYSTLYKGIYCNCVLVINDDVFMYVPHGYSYATINIVDWDTETITKKEQKLERRLGNIHIVDNYIFNTGHNYSYNTYIAQMYKINADYSLTMLDELINNNYNGEDTNALIKYMPVAVVRSNASTTLNFRPIHICKNNNKIEIVSTGFDYDSFITIQACVTIYFNTLKEKFEYCYPNFNYNYRQLTGFVDCGNNRFLGYKKNNIYLFDKLEDEPLVVQCGNSILYSYVNNFNEPLVQLQPDQ